jgi:hypothetical protein
MLSLIQINGGRISDIVGSNTSPKFICEKAMGIKIFSCKTQCCKSDANIIHYFLKEFVVRSL